MQPVRVAILGARGAVGQVFIQLLEERKFPLQSLKLLGSKRSAGMKMTFKGEELLIEEATPDSFEDIQLVLSSSGSQVSRELVPHAVKAGALVVDNTSAFRMEDEVPLVIPEINPQEIAKHKGIIANPNCSTIIMLMPLYPLHKISPIKRIIVSTYQSASGAGQRAMEELLNQTHEVLEGKMPTKEIFPHQIAFNLFSHDSKIGPDGYCEEETKMVNETKKIFGDNSIEVMPTTVRVPVLRAHSEAIVVEQESRVRVEQAIQALEKAPGIRLVNDPKENRFPMPIMAQDKDDVLVGRIRVDHTAQNSLAMFVCGDQLRKGAALNAIQIAEIWGEIR